MLLFFILAKIINWICTLFAKNKTVRLIGMYFYDPNASKNLKNSYIKFFMEAYFDNCFCTFLNLTSLLRAKDLNLFFSTRDDIFSSMVTIFYVLTILAFPVWVFFKIKAKLGYLNHKENLENIGFLYEGVKIKQGVHAYYNVFFLSRRLLTALVLMFLKENPFFQCQFLLVFSTMNFIYMISEQPLSTPKENFIEIFNEFTIMISAHITSVFLNVAIPQEARDLMGWVLMGLSAVNIVVNLIIIVYGTAVYDMYYPLVDRFELSKARKQFVLNQANKKYLIKKLPGMLEEFESEEEFHKGILTVKKFHLHRQWLEANGLDFSEFEEEKEYQAINRKLGLEIKAMQRHFTQGLALACWKKT